MHPQITGVDYTTSDVHTPAPEPLPETKEGDNPEAEEGGEENNDEDKTGATTPPHIRINEDSERESDSNNDTEE